MATRPTTTAPLASRSDLIHRLQAMVGELAVRRCRARALIAAALTGFETGGIKRMVEVLSVLGALVVQAIEGFPHIRFKQGKE